MRIENIEKLSQEELSLLFLTISEEERIDIVNNLEEMIKALQNIYRKLR